MSRRPVLLAVLLMQRFALFGTFWILEFPLNFPHGIGADKSQ